MADISGRPALSLEGNGEGVKLVEKGGAGEPGRSRARLNFSKDVMYESRIDKLKKERKKLDTKQAIGSIW